MLSFLAGPHACIGKTMAIIEMKAVLAALVANFIFEPSVVDQTIKPAAAITMSTLALPTTKVDNMQAFASTPNHPKRVFSAALPSTRRASTSSAPSAQELSPLPPKSTPNMSTSTGVAAFRSLRSFIPFGSSKHAPPTSALNTPKSPFPHFGSVRRSMQRERKVSLDVEATPVILIDQATKDELEEAAAVRRTVSCSKLLPNGEQEGSSYSFQNDDDDTVHFSSRRPPFLRTPSPIPLISDDLSTILEADTSGMSKHVPVKDFSRTPSPEPSDSMNPPELFQKLDTDTSELDLSTTNLEDQVLDAMRSNKRQEWTMADTAVIIDGEDFTLHGFDSDLVAMPIPNRFAVQTQTADVDDLTQRILQTPNNQVPILVSQTSISSSQTLLAPSPIISEGRSNTSPSLNLLRSRLPRQQSSLPRLRPPLPPSPQSPHTPTPTTAAPSSSCSDSTRGLWRTNPPSPLTLSNPASSPSSAPPSPAAAVHAPKAITSPLSTSSTSFFSRHSSTNKNQASINPPSLVTSQHKTSSTASRLKAPFTEMRPSTKRILPEPGHSEVVRSFTPSSSTSKLVVRPSLDSTARESSSPRPSFSSDAHYSEQSRSARPSLDILPESSADISNARTAAEVLERARKRSLSVQDRLERRPFGSKRRGTVSETDYNEFDDDRATELGEYRPASSLSVRQRWPGSGHSEGGPNGNAPMTDWLGPRTVKAFKAAGLLDFERDQQPQDRSNPNSISPLGSGVGPTHGRFASMRSASEYNPRAPSRLAASEAGGSSISRRGSGSGTFGLMESPTFTISSRETPRSASTAPTSVSASSSNFLGRDRDREREEIRDLKEKHASETGALLGALSDSQRTSRLLREENGELKERLREAEAQISALRRVVGELTQESGDLRVQLQMLKMNPRGSTTGTFSRRGGRNSPLPPEQNEDKKWSSFNDIKDRDSSDITLGHRKLLDRKDLDGTRHHVQPESHAGLSMMSSTPIVSKHKRRFSTSSSIFPVPPANMTMLLHDHDSDTGSLLGSLDQSQFSLPMPETPSLRDDTVTHRHNTSLTSAVNISPTTANFSMATGSPGSLFLRPEHEIHLGDMDSLDLGNARKSRQDGWSD
ncbi:hypothetical protein H0H93_010165 [Arthromyces matolae]|nr:hypothetical protein H0H93_010165 [Arthromyces matolae]